MTGAEANSSCIPLKKIFKYTVVLKDLLTPESESSVRCKPWCQTNAERIRAVSWKTTCSRRAVGFVGTGSQRGHVGESPIVCMQSCLDGISCLHRNKNQGDKLKQTQTEPLGFSP